MTAFENMASTVPTGRASIERQLEVKPATDSGPDIFANKNPLWHPEGARAIFGGIAIAQSLSAAYETVGREFDAHSMHCTFVFAGTADATLHYHVNRVRDGKTFCTRAVKAVQNGRTIFLTTISFARLLPESTINICHAEPMPLMVPQPHDSNGNEQPTGSPYMNQSVGLLNFRSLDPCDKCMHQWVKTREKISSHGGSRTHLVALAFMSDSYFLAGLPHSHNIWRFVNPPITEFYDSEERIGMPSPIHTMIPRPHLEGGGRVPNQSPTVVMMVSLDHTIYFHQPRKFKADEWLLIEVKTDWAANGRGLVAQKIWAQDGTLIASCTQEVKHPMYPYFHIQMSPLTSYFSCQGILRLEQDLNNHQTSEINPRL